ncbi:glycosyltransferase [Salinivibrio kushneri]|uniref:glycosyltransferase n=1 Tax=Salinivibrio kushneri TaxID=1908198 RepID=UPI0022B5BA1B|nr:glycosyltransferase [Salinivibrio kushneri]WBA18078.1 glycosyltransferase [Salinivibrio kushneri]
MKSKSATLIISFYNNKNALELIFQSLTEQWNHDFNVVIADDGSKEEVKNWLSVKVEQLPFSVTHVWHEDKGFRKNRILNKAILASKSDYLIFIDGDCVPQHGFVRDHLQVAERGTVVCGRRVELSKKYTDLLVKTNKKSTFSHKYMLSMLVDYLVNRREKNTTEYTGKHLKNGLCLPWLQRLTSLSSKPRSIIGCNFSIYKKDLERINGFDMNYEAPAVGEDTDIEFRLKGVGVRTKAIKFGAALLHMYHHELPRPSTNKDIFDRTVQEKAFWASNGLNKLKS